MHELDCLQMDAVMGRLQLSYLGEWLSNCGGPEVCGPTGSRPTGSQTDSPERPHSRTSVAWLGLCRFDSCRRHTMLVKTDGLHAKGSKRGT